MVKLGCACENLFVPLPIQVPTSSVSVAHKEAAAKSESNLGNEPESSSDQNDRESTLGDAISINQEKDTSVASLEELQNLAGGADIKVCQSL